VELIPLIIVAVAWIIVRSIRPISDVILQRDWLKFCRDMEAHAATGHESAAEKIIEAASGGRAARSTAEPTKQTELPSGSSEPPKKAA
jgi:hypothetical protein